MNNSADSKLDGYLSSYTKFNDWLIRRRYQKLSEYFYGTSCLEMGCSEGSGTKYLIDKFDEVVSVDGSPEAIALVTKRYPNPGFKAVCSYFEEMNFGEKRFDCIILAHILEHVDDPVKVLSQAKKYSAPGGVIIIDVPNGNSLHRQVGVNLGLLTELTQLNDADLSIGHQRVYMPDTFQADILRSGLKINKFGGMFMKVLSNAQTEKVFNDKQLEALFAVGEKNPDIAAEIFVVAEV